jgi:hypothetical protein
LTLRPLEDALHAFGLAVNTATLGLHLFATERLRTLGEAVTDLSGLDVKTMQPRLNALKRYAQSRSSISEDDLYAQVFEPVFRRIAQQYPHTGTFSVAATCEACEIAMAHHLGEPVESLRSALRSKGDSESQVNPSAPAAGSSRRRRRGGRTTGACQALCGRRRHRRRRPSGTAVSRGLAHRDPCRGRR